VLIVAAALAIKSSSGSWRLFWFVVVIAAVVADPWE